VIDGKAAGVVHLGSTGTIRRRVVFTRTWAADGPHTIRIVVLGTPGHPTVDLDALLTLR
jgi:hypothetical protein